MPRPASPLDLWANTMQLAMIAAEAQWVIGLRLMGMAGLWAVAPSEIRRMVTEKMQAFNRSMTGATLAAMSGNKGDAVLAAALKPIRRTTRANARRLAGRGPKRR